VARVALHCPDLLFGSKLQGALRAAGHEPVEPGEDAEILVVDLTDEPDARIEQAAAAGVPRLGFYSHVEQDVRRRAEDAGFERVVPRSRMAREAAALVDSMLEGPAVHDELLRIEDELGAGPGDPYRRHLAEDAVVIVPGAVLDRDTCAAAMDASPGWDEREIIEPRTIMLTPDSALLTYRWRSRRGDDVYAAVMSSDDARRDGSWRLVLHQQTPEPGPS
jgi:hypothetical protein